MSEERLRLITAGMILLVGLAYIAWLALEYMQLRKSDQKIASMAARLFTRPSEAPAEPEGPASE